MENDTVGSARIEGRSDEADRLFTPMKSNLHLLEHV
jgi:hypothetical protein